MAFPPNAQRPMPPRPGAAPAGARPMPAGAPAPRPSPFMLKTPTRQPQEIAGMAKGHLNPQEKQVLQQALTPEVINILVKLFGPAAAQYLTPLLQDDGDAGQGMMGQMPQPGGAPRPMMPTARPQSPLAGY